MSDKQTFHQNTHCGICGMVRQGNDYHPDLACFAHANRPTEWVSEQLRAVVEYGMKAAQQGKSLDQAMAGAGEAE